MKERRTIAIFKALAMRLCMMLSLSGIPQRGRSQSTIYDSLSIIKNTIIDIEPFSGSWGMRELDNITVIDDSTVLGLFSKNSYNYNLYSLKQGQNPQWKLEISDWGNYGRTVGRVINAAKSLYVLTYTRDTFYILQIECLQSKYKLHRIAGIPLYSLDWRHQTTFDTNSSTWMLHLGYYDPSTQYVDSVKIFRIRYGKVKTVYTYKIVTTGFSNPFPSTIYKNNLLFTFNSDSLFILFEDTLKSFPLSVYPVYYITYFDSIDDHRVFAFISHDFFTFSKSFVLDEKSKDIIYTKHLDSRNIKELRAINISSNRWYSRTSGDSTSLYNFSDTFGNLALKTFVFKSKNRIETPYFINNYLIGNSLYGDTFISSFFSPVGRSYDSLMLDGPIGKIIDCNCGQIIITRKHSTQIFGNSFSPRTIYHIDTLGSIKRLINMNNSPIAVLESYPRIYEQMDAFVFFTTGKNGNIYYSTLSLDSICPIANATFKNEEFIIFPNPGTERLYSNQDVSEIIVYNAIGQKMKKNIGSDDRGRKYIDILDFTPGLYFVYRNGYSVKFLKN